MPLSPRTLRPANTFTPRSISGLALWLDASATGDLYTTDAGPVVPVSSPTEISGCALWLDGADSSAASMTLNGSLVETWKDKSGNNRNATASGTARPTLTGSALNGRSVVTFDGTANQMQIDGTFLVTSNATIFAVARRTSGGFGAVITSKGTGDTSPSLQHASGSWQINHAGNLSVIGAQAGYAVLSGTISAGATAAFANGLLQDSDASSGSLASDATKTYIGTYRAAIANVLAGEIAEIVVYNTALSTADRARVEAYLAQRWGITGVHAAATSASDPVGYWRDRSGNGRHLTQPVAAARPSLLTSGISSRPALRFDGTDDNIWRQPGLTSDELSLLMVYQVDSLTGGVIYDLSHSGDVTNSQAQNLTGFFNGLAMQVSAAGIPTHQMDSTRAFVEVNVQGRSGNAGDVTAGTPALSSASATYSATASSIRKQGWINGRGLSGFTRFNAGGWSHITLGCRRNNQNAGGINSPTVFLNGRIAEVLAYSRYLPDKDRRRLELYLARKWSIALAGAPTVSNPDAQDWIDRVYGNGGTVTASTASAVDTFCNAIDAAGIRDRFYRLSLMCGGTSGTTAGLNACLVPLYRGPSLGGTQFGNTTDTNNGPFLPADYNETGPSGGLAGNGSSKYLNTGLAPNAIPDYATGHLSAYAKEGFGGSTIYSLIGSLGSGYGENYFIEANRSAGALAGSWGGGSFATLATAAQGAGVGHTIVSRTSSTSLRAYKNGTALNTSTSSVTPAANANALFVFAHNNLGGGSALNHFLGRLGGYSVGASLSDSQALAFSNAMQAFQTALGRNV